MAGDSEWRTGAADHAGETGLAGQSGHGRAGYAACRRALAAVAARSWPLAAACSSGGGTAPTRHRVADGRRRPDLVAAVDVSQPAAPTTRHGAASTTAPPARRRRAGRRAGPATVAELLTRRIVLAHAGGDDDYPHSTPFAFAESAKAGVDVLDLDVRLSADGVLVVQHDDDVDRTTNATGPVATRTYAELHALDNAYWFNTHVQHVQEPPRQPTTCGGASAPAPSRRRRATPPTTSSSPRFRDIATRFPDLPLNIEIKGTIDDGIGVPVATALAAELKALGRRGQHRRHVVRRRRARRPSTSWRPTWRCRPGCRRHGVGAGQHARCPTACASCSSRPSTRASPC